MRFHLSTAILCVLVASLFIGRNLEFRPVFEEVSSVSIYRKGWPFAFLERNVVDARMVEIFTPAKLVVNIILAIAIILLFAFVLEYRQRRLRDNSCTRCSCSADVKDEKKSER